LGDQGVIAVEGDDFSIVRKCDAGDEEIERPSAEAAVRTRAA
jgi:hypothetical protein